ncbi:hypothetical protein [Pantoea ananatis]|uniref:hypothetical protein n=1 Tax=Pantoea ananas TaxID=553 RepID=UPI0004914968|nr:hypothetical protein [Pantoea ananatis]
MNNVAEISAHEVVRDRWGHWTHPFYYSPPEDREFALPGAFNDWLKANNLKSATSWMENEVEERQMNRFWKTGDCSDWTPAKPPGEGWFTGSIHDTDDGPVCVWLRPLSDRTDE